MEIMEEDPLEELMEMGPLVVQAVEEDRLVEHPLWILATELQVVDLDLGVI